MITSLWESPVHTAQLASDVLARVAADSGLLPSLLPTGHPGRDLTWTSRTEQWKGGFHAGLRHGTGAWCALIVLGARTSHVETLSGAVVLHDPRAGAANVGLPGLPWGRPLTLTTRPGLLAVVPGWLGWQVAPVRADDERTVLTADSA
ncbi:hypothetical protein [Streptomyces violascens]|uniref:hypothetical protein n=1 Tax=Streptomyces violascens TaxID=67381 RepID=UPI001679D8FB|nr:hypothetical protein [Streptomyces violascens]GGU37804.1 hypothetical protein GCM10010289_68420 [Streptomyces violascens]